MGVLALGLNHTTAPLDLRGKLAFAAEQLAPAAQALRARLSPVLPHPEVALVSTCNRTELYVGSTQPLASNAALHHLSDWLAHWCSVQGPLLRSHTYGLEGDQAVRHAFRVASGLDSMVLGEPQILGQMKAAVRQADGAGTLGTTLHQMFQRSFAVAKEVRSSTAIGEHSISMAASVVRLAEQLFGSMEELRVLLVGAGDMIELVGTHMAARHPKHMCIANRTLERAEKLAVRLGAQGLRLADLPQHLPQFDVVVSCTASTLPLIGLGAVERALRARKRRPMFMVDLAVPRDIEPEVAELEDVYLYTVDDLSTLVQVASEKRLAAVAQAEAIIETGVQGFAQWLYQRRTVPLIQSLHQQAQEWQELELQKARKLLAKGLDAQQVLEHLARGLSQKWLHGPLAELHAAQGPEHDRLCETLGRIHLRSSPSPRNNTHE
jgi:glutamyl-tRNA reductase